MPEQDIFNRTSDYDRMLQQGLRLSGEDKTYFADRRVAALARYLAGQQVDRILDYGCGLGETSGLLRDRFSAKRVLGVETAGDAVAYADQHFALPEIRYQRMDQFEPSRDFDLCYVNGVFHHIVPSRRGEALQTIHRALRPGGWLALFENNPWNPGTRLVMSRIEFDRDAITISPIQARRLLRDHGFTVSRQRFLFYFPRALRLLRPCERLAETLPLGAQYLTLARKESRSSEQD